MTPATFGPEELGRGIVLNSGAILPQEFRRAPRFDLDDEALLRPSALLAELHAHWLARRRVVVLLAPGIKEQLKQLETLEIEPYRLDPAFEFSQERLHFLVWANNYDATGEQPIWWYRRLAQRLGAAPHPEAEVDLEGPCWCDGGPRLDLPFPVLHRESIKAGQLELTLPQGESEQSLAPDQEQAVQHRGGAARILAPAGSGKTRVLTQRFANLLQRGVAPAQITAVAYNRRAALEMNKRLPSSRLNIRTLHALGHSLLGRQVAHVGQIRAQLKRLVKVAPALNVDPYQPYLEALGQVRLGLRDPEEVEQEREDVPGFAEAFPRYRGWLKKNRLVDHDEQIYGAIELLLHDAQARKKAQAQCVHLLVDEFQDLTPAFLLMLRLLGAPAYQVFGVGDDDQVIYGYAGATPEYLVKFDRYFPAAKKYQLRMNYRCPWGVVEAASHLLACNRFRVEKEVEVFSDSTAQPELLLAPQEAWTEKALEWLEERLEQFEPQQIAVLSRVNALLLPLQVALRQLGLPHSQVVDDSILERTGVRTALAYWRLCRDPDAMAAEDLADALRRPNRKLKSEYIERASRCERRVDLQRLTSQLDSWPSSQLEEFLVDLAFLERRLKKGHASFFQALRKETQFLEALDQLDSHGLGSAGSSHGDDLVALEQLAHMCEEDDFERWLRDWLSQPPEPGPGIRLSSVHRVKGLEWPCVLVFGVESGLFPHRLSEDEEEERRILHVALTRAKAHCALVGTARNGSPFLAEMQSGKG